MPRCMVRNRRWNGLEQARLLMWTRLDPVHDGLHEESRFQALIAKMKL
jgi:hypothetical protein